jgi:hypothetical protein
MPEVVEAAEKAKRNQVQFQRRDIARTLLPSIIERGEVDVTEDVAIALEYADLLLEKTATEE